MALYAELADGRRLEFPDGTNPAVIQSTVKRLVGQSQAQTQAAPDDTNMGEAALIAAGRGTDKLIQGVRQAYNWLADDKATLAKMAAEQADNDKAYAPLQQKFPLTTGIAETAPTAAAALLTGGTSIPASMAMAGAQSLMSYGTPEERLKRAGADAVSGAAGNLAGRGIARLLKPAGAGTEGASSAALQSAERLGYRPTPAQISQNPGMAAFENYLLRTPGSSGTMQKVAEANQQALNRAGAKAMGETANTLDDGVFASAQRRIGDEFNRLGAITKPQLGNDFINTLATIETQNGARGPFANKQVSGLIDKGLELAAKGDLDGAAYKQIRTELSNQAQTAFRGGDATTGQAYKSVVSALDDAAKASLSDADKKAWDVARKEWQAFKTLTKSNVAEGGNVSAARTAAAVRTQGPGLRAGRIQGELADVARIGEAFKGVSNPTSGQLAQQMMFSNPLTGIPLFLGNKAAAAAYMSPLGQRYFSRGLIDVGQTGQGLLSQAGVNAAIPIGRGLLGVE